MLTEDRAVWKDVILEFYGVDGGLSSNRIVNGKSIGASIVNCLKNLVLSRQYFFSSFNTLKAKDLNSYFGKMKLWKEDIS